MPSIRRSVYIVGITIGAFTAVASTVFSGILLLLLGKGPIGGLEPFTALTQVGVSPVTAAIWTQFDLLGVFPTVQTENLTVIRGVLNGLDHGSGNYSLYRIVPPILLTMSGGLTVALVRRLSSGDPDGVIPLTGGCISLGFSPVLLFSLWVATVPVAPEASGEVRVGNTILPATDLAGVAAGPAPLMGILTAVVYPLFFGSLGGLIFEAMSAFDA